MMARSVSYVSMAKPVSMARGNNLLAIIDVRDDERSNQAHIGGSHHYASSGFKARMPELARAASGKDTLVFHCALSQRRQNRYDVGSLEPLTTAGAAHGGVRNKPICCSRPPTHAFPPSSPHPPDPTRPDPTRPHGLLAPPPLPPRPLHPPPRPDPCPRPTRRRRRPRCRSVQPLPPLLSPSATRRARALVPPAPAPWTSAPARASSRPAALWSYALAFGCTAGFVVTVLATFQDQLVFYVTPTDALAKFAAADPSKSRVRPRGGSCSRAPSPTPPTPGSPEMEFVVTVTSSPTCSYATTAARSPTSSVRATPSSSRGSSSLSLTTSAGTTTEGRSPRRRGECACFLRAAPRCSPSTTRSTCPKEEVGEALERNKKKLERRGGGRFRGGSDGGGCCCGRWSQGKLVRFCIPILRFTRSQV
ncbi:hypothetical protein PR202_ga07739 [Eleusine coracana subsp. coracana]|uniref:Rhodanese domain-containing protein n=1 Tax=Eleusine coracana subsp. coracana TaxID=191504 RepID=A0AAV5BZF2_ELECO|nr:hypothetical protein PR202_ga07739 [Eleusine coracana subsp. coracana]